MTIDRQRLLNKISFVKEQTSALRKLLAEKTQTEIMENPWILIGFRNRVVHGYQEASLEQVYNIAKNNLAALDEYVDTVKRNINIILKQNLLKNREVLLTYTTIIQNQSLTCDTPSPWRRCAGPSA